MKCKMCKSTFVDNSRSKTKKYCSRKCFFKYYQTTEKCKQINYNYNNSEAGRRTKQNAKTNLRRARMINATPKWITDKDKKEMQKIYKSCPKGYHVDHIVPLRGKNVCGLHVPNNLRVVPAYVNMSKGNRFDIRLSH